MAQDSNSFDTNLYDDGALHAIIMSFIIAGRDTTARPHLPRTWFHIRQGLDAFVRGAR